MTIHRLAIATGNKHKVEEFRALFVKHGLDIDLVPITDLMERFDVEETGHTFEDNAYIKAMAGYDLAGMAVLADDSGLEVDELQGAPGVYSARYAGESATDADNRALLKANLIERGLTVSTARFRCVLALVTPSGTVMSEGASEGTVVPDERGSNGFGYDSMFIPSGESHTFGELAPEVKHLRSHRAQAVERLVAQLRGQSPHTLTESDHLRWLLRTSIGAVRPDTAYLRSVFAAMPTEMLRHEHVREVLLQSYLFAGFPAALDAFTVYADVTLQPALHEPEPFDIATFAERGETTCRAVYGGVYDRMMERLRKISPELQSWMLVEGYGKTLSRTSMPLLYRELCTVCMLATLGRSTQLYSHVRGALNVGASAQQLQECIDAVAEDVSAAAALDIRTILEKIV